MLNGEQHVSEDRKMIFFGFKVSEVGYVPQRVRLSPFPQCSVCCMIDRPREAGQPLMSFAIAWPGLPPISQHNETTTKQQRNNSTINNQIPITH